MAEIRLANPLRLVVYPSIYDGVYTSQVVSWISCNNSSVGCEFTSIAADDETELEFKADQCIIDFAQDKHDALESCAQNSHHRVVPKPHLRKNNNYSKLTRRFTGKGPKV